MSHIEVIHTPHGQEHPYEFLPEERTPREPLAGQSFTVGIVTRPPASVTQVTLHSQLDGVDQPPILARRIVEWRPELEHGVGAEFLERIVRIEQDVWQADLVAPAHGHTLVYWAEADGISSAHATLHGESWTTGGGYSIDADSIMHLSRTASPQTVPQGLPAPLSVEWLTDVQRARRVRLTFNAPADEGFYGLGERFNALNQRGEVIDVRCYEQYKNQGKRTYMPIPFLLSSNGYGVWVKSSRYMVFDLAASTPDRWTLEADLGADEALDLAWFCGGSPFDIVAQFTQQTGPAVLPPWWSFGLWMSGNEWNSQARVIKEVQASLDHDIQPTVLVIEAWSDETTFYIWNDAQYTPTAGADAPRYSDFTFPPEGKWPNPKGMVDWLHENDVRLLLWQIPALKKIDAPHAQHDADWAHFEQSGFGIREADGTLHRIRPFWFRGGAIWDPTRPAEREWWLNKRAYLLDDLGIDGFKTDGGEHLWGTQVVFGDGRRGDENWNEYPRHYTEAYYQFASSKREAITFSRAGYTGSQRAPLHWAGDENSTWEAYQHSIYAGFSAALSGIHFWGWDFGGFSGEVPSAELYLRAAAMAAFCPVMQYHSEYNAHREPSHDRTPWNIQSRSSDEQVIPVFRHLVNVRYNLLPYIWQEAQHTAVTGEPLMRPLKLIDAEAPEFAYLFGRDLLVTPVVEAGAETVTVRLPAGTWRDLWTGERVSGSQTLTVAAPIDHIPVYVRDGARVPVRLEGGTLGARVTPDVTPDAILFE